MQAADYLNCGYQCSGLIKGLLGLAGIYFKMKEKIEWGKEDRGGKTTT